MPTTHSQTGCKGYEFGLFYLCPLLEEVFVKYLLGIRIEIHYCSYVGGSCRGCYRRKLQLLLVSQASSNCQDRWKCALVWNVQVSENRFEIYYCRNIYCTRMCMELTEDTLNYTQIKAYILQHSYPNVPVELEPKFGQTIHKSKPTYYNTANPRLQWN